MWFAQPQEPTGRDTKAQCDESRDNSSFKKFSYSSIASTLIVTGWLQNCEFLMNPHAALGLTAGSQTMVVCPGVRFPGQREGCAGTHHAAKPAGRELAVCLCPARRQLPARYARRAQGSGRAGRSIAIPQF